MKTSMPPICKASWIALTTSGQQTKPLTSKLQLSQQTVQYPRLSLQALRKWQLSQHAAEAEVEEVSGETVETAETEEDNVEGPLKDLTPGGNAMSLIHPGTAVEPIGFMLMLLSSVSHLQPVL